LAAWAGASGEALGSATVADSGLVGLLAEGLDLAVEDLGSDSAAAS
jgi:hypothetical protein